MKGANSPLHVQSSSFSNFLSLKSWTGSGAKRLFRHAERTVAGATVLFSPFDGEIFVNPFPFLLQIRGMDGIFFLGRQKRPFAPPFFSFSFRRKKRIAASSEEGCCITLPPGRRKLHIRSLLLPLQTVTALLGHSLVLGDALGTRGVWKLEKIR